MVDKPTAWYDPSNGVVSTDRDCPLFTPLGQVWPLFLEEQQITADCPKCEYNKNRAARWRAEAYKQGGHDVIELPWVGLTDEEIWEAYMESPVELNCTTDDLYAFSRIIETKAKEKNNG
jgi:hypothetical protein